MHSIINDFVGDYRHYPPMYSAKKINGVRLYKLARENKIIKRDSILSNISEIKLIDYTKTMITFSVTCSKGTYVRVLGSDIAEKFGTVGYLNKLVRTKIGEFNIANTIKIKDFEKQWKFIAN